MGPRGEPAGPQPLIPAQSLTLTSARAVGGPVGLRLLASFFALGLLGWLAAGAALVTAAPDLAAADPGAPRPVLAAHLLALGLLPLAVSGSSFHLLPVMLRNSLHDEAPLRWALGSLALGAALTAPGIATDTAALVWPGAALVAA